MIVWLGLVAEVAFLITKKVFDVRVSEEAEREGLDIISHGKTVYEN